VLVTHEVSNQAAIITDAFRAGTVGYSRSGSDASITTHLVYQSNEPVVV
jgi:hypothetical protein